MPPRAASHKRFQQRLRRTMNYGNLRMDNLTMPLSEMVVDYFDRHNPFDYLDIGYASKLARDGCVDPTTLLIAMVYVDRLRRASPQYFVETSPDDIYLSALVIAGKFLQDGGLDEFIWNDEWAQCSSKTIQKVNELEIQILLKLDWNLHVTEEEFKEAVESAEKWIALHSLKQHKFLTYNDIAILAKKWDASWKQVKMFFTYTGAISATYLGTFYLALLCASFYQSQQHEKSLSLPQTTTTNDSTTVETPSTSESQSFSATTTTSESLDDFDIPDFSYLINYSNDSIVQKAKAAAAYLPLFQKFAQQPVFVYNKERHQQQQQRFEEDDRWRGIVCY